MSAETPQPASAAPPNCDFVCSETFDPVCGSNGATFDNACQLNQTRCASGDDTLEIVSQGVCSSDNSGSGSASSCVQEFACLDVFTPVCGSDSQTYSNECFLRRAQCSDPTLTMVSEGECTGDGASRNSTAEEAGRGSDMEFASSTSGSGICAERVCTKEFSPLCGSDGATYANECLFQNAKCVDSALAIAFEGECSAVSRSSASTSASIAGLGPAVGSDASISPESAASETGTASIPRKSFTLMAVVAVLWATVTL